MEANLPNMIRTYNAVRRFAELAGLAQLAHLMTDRTGRTFTFGTPGTRGIGNEGLRTYVRTLRTYVRRCFYGAPATIGTHGSDPSKPTSSHGLYVRTYVRAVLAGRLALSWLVASTYVPVLARASYVHTQRFVDGAATYRATCMIVFAPLAETQVTTRNHSKLPRHVHANDAF